MEELKEGIYLVKDEPFATAYFVNKVMPKTVEVHIKTADWSKGNSPLSSTDTQVSKSSHYRYNKDLLKKQVQDAEYREYETNKG